LTITLRYPKKVMPLHSETSVVKFNTKENTILVGWSLSNRGSIFDAKLVLDTGASLTIISWSVANILNLNPSVAKNTVEFYSASGKIEAPLIKIDELRVQNSVVKDFEIIVHDLPMLQVFMGF